MGPTFFLFPALAARRDTDLGYFGARCVKPVRVTDMVNSFRTADISCKALRHAVCPK